MSSFAHFFGSSLVDQNIVGVFGRILTWNAKADHCQGPGPIVDSPDNSASSIVGFIGGTPRLRLNPNVF